MEQTYRVRGVGWMQGGGEARREGHKHSTCGVYWVQRRCAVLEEVAIVCLSGVNG